MLKSGHSLWDQVPSTSRLELIPIVTTGFLAQAGSLTAALFVRLGGGTPYGQAPNPVAVNDLTGLFIFANFIVIMIFAYLTLKASVTKGGEISLNAKVIGLASAFVTILELYSYALKSGQPERLAYALLALFFVFFVPFFLVRRLSPAADGSHGAAVTSRETATQALAALELLVYGLVLCGATVLVCSAYFVILNEGIGLAGSGIVSSFVEDTLGQKGRAEFWGVGPGILGIGWLPVVFLFAVSTKRSGDEDVVFGINPRGKAWVLIGALIVNALLGSALIGDSLIPQLTSGGMFLGLKAGLAVVITLLFLLAFAAARGIDQCTCPQVAKIVLHLIVFFAAGALLGWIVLRLRQAYGSPLAVMIHLVWMHGAGFALAYLAGWVSVVGLRRVLPDASPILDVPARAMR